MKLVEKLAQDFWRKNRELNLQGEGTWCETEAYEAGFRVAIQLVLAEVAFYRVFCTLKNITVEELFKSIANITDQEVKDG